MPGFCFGPPLTAKRLRNPDILQMDNVRTAAPELSPAAGHPAANGVTATVENQPDGEIREIVDSKAIVSAPLVSVLMVTYNHAQYIGAAIACTAHESD